MSFSDNCNDELKENPTWSPVRNGYDIDNELTSDLYTYFLYLKQGEKDYIDYFKIEESYLKAKNNNSPTFYYYELLYNEDNTAFIKEYEENLGNIYYIPNSVKSVASYVQDFQFTLNGKRFKELNQYQSMVLIFDQLPNKEIQVGVKDAETYQCFYQ